MLFADANAGQVLLIWLAMLWLAWITVKRMIKGAASKIADNETVKTAVKNGATQLLSRLFKK